MSENPPEVTSPPEPPEPDKGEQTGFMVYDHTLLRFVGHKADSKSAAEDTVTKVKGHKYETRKV